MRGVGNIRESAELLHESFHPPLPTLPGEVLWSICDAELIDPLVRSSPDDWFSLKRPCDKIPFSSASSYGRIDTRDQAVISESCCVASRICDMGINASFFITRVLSVPLEIFSDRSENLRIVQWLMSQLRYSWLIFSVYRCLWEPMKEFLL